MFAKNQKQSANYNCLHFQQHTLLSTCMVYVLPSFSFFDLISIWTDYRQIH